MRTGNSIRTKVVNCRAGYYTFTALIGKMGRAGANLNLATPRSLSAFGNVANFLDVPHLPVMFPPPYFYDLCIIIVGRKLMKSDKTKS